MTEFARKQLEKYGWKKGQGLGRKEKGITEPIKVGIKRDHGGVGLAPGGEFSDQWWSSVFEAAASNISVDNSDGGVLIQTRSGNETSLPLKQRHYGMYRKSLLYGGFVQSSGAPQNETTSNDGHDPKPGIAVPGSSISDEDLFKACGGRTAHKAARHGLTLSGKLRRVQCQETDFLEQPSACFVSRNGLPESFHQEKNQETQLSACRLKQGGDGDIGVSARAKKRRIDGIKVGSMRPVMDICTSSRGAELQEKCGTRRHRKSKTKYFTATSRTQSDT